MVWCTGFPELLLMQRSCCNAQNVHQVRLQHIANCLQRQEYNIDILNAMEALSKEGNVPKWGGALQDLDRRNVFIGELSRVGIKKPDLIGKPSVRNDAAFLYTLVGVTSVVAVAAGSLPGDWVK